MKKEKESITINKLSLWKGFAGVLIVLLAISIFTGGFSGNNATGAVVQDQAKVAPTPSPNPTPKQVAPSNLDASKLADDDPFLGREDAPITIVEFSDYQCPFCRRFYSDTYEMLKKEYVDTGKVKFVYRDFPLSFHPAAQPSAEAANCARDQGGNEGYFEFHDKIFEEQGKMGTGTVQYGVAELKQWAADLGLDTKKFNSCLDSGRYAEEIRADFVAGQVAGIRGTPGFIVGDQLLSGAQPFSAFKAVIDAQLTK